MSIVRAAIAASAACLIGVAAHAQSMGDNGQGPPAGQASPPDQMGAPSDQGGSGQMSPGDQSAPNGQMGAPSDQQTGASAPDTAGAAANASATTTTDAQGDQVIASQPVPDTPANRAKYGQPMSRTGRLTTPSGD